VHLHSVELGDSEAGVHAELARCKADLLKTHSEVAVTSARAQQLELETHRLTANAGRFSHT
jgi:hypothetical protein